MICYFVFWISTIQDTIIRFQQKQYNSDSNNGIILGFRRCFPEIKEEKNRVRVRRSWFLIERLQDLHTFVFLFFVSITRVPREAGTNCTWGLASAKNREDERKDTWHMYINLHFFSTVIKVHKFKPSVHRVSMKNLSPIL